MESLGYAFVALVWGAPVAALVIGVVAAVAAVRWRRRAIAALELAELGADVQQAGTATTAAVSDGSQAQAALRQPE